MEQQELIDRIKKLPHDHLLEVAEFVESLTLREGYNDRRGLHQALFDYAVQHAGTSADLDPQLEETAADHLLSQDSES